MDIVAKVGANNETPDALAGRLGILASTLNTIFKNRKDTENC
jgi:hypothetical protein